VVRLPVHVYDHVAKINKVTRSLSRQPGRQQPVTYAEIGALIAGSVSYVGQR
jgi:DNA-directed RNA polymerase sigma subunit (sigma70/sigma32)